MGDLAREDRAARLTRYGTATRRLVSVLARYYTAEELGQMFDALPDEGSLAMTALTSAVGQAWAENREDPATD